MLQDSIRRKRNIKRLIIALVLVAALTAAFLLTRKREPIPVIRVVELTQGDISRNYYITANIRAGAVTDHSAEVSQKVKEIKVSVHQQVNEGDILVVLDQDELKDEYEAARDARIQLEKKAAEEKRIAEQRSKELSEQISLLSSSLSEAISQFSAIAGSSPSEVEIDPELSDKLNEVIEQMQPETAQEDLTAIIEIISGAVKVSDNEDHSKATEEVRKQLEAANAALESLLNKITAEGTGSLLFSASDISGQLSGLSAMGISVQSPLDQAKARESAAKSRLDKSQPYIKAKTPGLVSAVNVKVGDHTGPSSSSDITSGLGDLSSISGLEGLLSGINSGTANGGSAVTIYDNTIPEAFFYAGRFDSGRIEEGMPVKFTYEELEFTGEVIKEGRIAASSGVEQIPGLEMFGSSSGSSFTSEPQVEIVLSIGGDRLTDLVPGFTIDAQIETASVKNVVMLPAEAMRRELGKYYVFILNEDETVSRQYFEPGIQSELFVQVISGLKKGDKVVMSPPAELEDGMKVKVSEDE